MNRRHTPCALAVAVLAILLLDLALTVGATAARPAQLIGEAVQVLEEMSQQSDAEAMARLLQKAKGVAIFPSVIKAGLMVGGRYGEGLVLRYDPGARAWYGPGFVTLKGVSYGPQFGFQSTALVLVIANDRGLKGFRGDKVTLGGELAVAAGPVGRHAEASTDAELKASIFSYSMSKGLFAGLALEGAVITANEANNEAYWKSALLPDQALARPAAAEEIKPLLQELQRLLAQGK